MLEATVCAQRLNHAGMLGHSAVSNQVSHKPCALTVASCGIAIVLSQEMSLFCCSTLTAFEHFTCIHNAARSGADAATTCETCPERNDSGAGCLGRVARQ